MIIKHHLDVKKYFNIRLVIISKSTIFFMDSIFDRLKNLREAHNYKQNFVANYLEISQQSYSRYENGKRELPIHFLPALAKLYGVSVDYILGLSMNSQDLESLSQKTYAGKTLKSIVDDLSALNNDNLISVIKYIEFLKSTQNSK